MSQAKEMFASAILKDIKMQKKREMLEAIPEIGGGSSASPLVKRGSKLGSRSPTRSPTSLTKNTDNESSKSPQHRGVEREGIHRVKS